MPHSNRTSRATSRPSRSARSRSHGRRRQPRNAKGQFTRRRVKLPPRDFRGRFMRRVPVGPMDIPRVRVETRYLRPLRPARQVRKRRWWRIDGPQDENLPKGWAYVDA